MHSFPSVLTIMSPMTVANETCWCGELCGVHRKVCSFFNTLQSMTILTMSQCLLGVVWELAQVLQQSGDSGHLASCLTCTLHTALARSLETAQCQCQGWCPVSPLSLSPQLTVIFVRWDDGPDMSHYTVQIDNIAKYILCTKSAGGMSHFHL